MTYDKLYVFNFEILIPRKIKKMNDSKLSLGSETTIDEPASVNLDKVR